MFVHQYIMKGFTKRYDLDMFRFKSEDLPNPGKYMILIMASSKNAPGVQI